MQPRMVNAARNASSSRALQRPPTRPGGLLRLPTSFPIGVTGIPTRATSNSLVIQEAVERLTSMSLDPQTSTAQEEELPSLIRGFRATMPSSELPKQRRRMLRGGMVDADFGYEKIGLKRLGDRARGLLTDGNEEEMTDGAGRRSRRRKHRRGGSFGRAGTSKLRLEDLVQQADEIAQDKENLHVRTVS